MESSEETSKEKVNKYKVIIIGAGIAGLSAAYHLTKNGISDFILLEARNRIGGRIIQIRMGNEKVELGANWIHGVLGNPIYELAMHYGLIDIMQIPKPHKLVASTEKGKQVPFQVLREVYEAYLCFLKRCEEYFLSEYLPPDGIDSVGQHIRLEVSIYLDKIKDKDERHLRELIFECLLKRETCISGCDNMNEIDLLELGTYEELQGGNIVLPEGYSSILKPFSEDIPSDNILLNHPVNLIKWNSSSNGNESDDSDKTVIDDSEIINNTEKSNEHMTNVEVTTSNNKKFFADHVICTIPLGVLKHKARTLFNPQLPEFKLEAVDRLLFGVVDKILLEYDRPFLNPNVTEVLLLWEPDDQTNCMKEDISKTWYKKIYSFSKISETLLLGWVSGKEAEYMETLSNDIIINVCTDILRKFLNDPFIPKPKNCVCTSWSSQQYTRGSYTAIAVGASQVDIDLLAQPLYADETETKPVVLFAGEHTHTNFYSTVHGAYLTGRTAAQTILSSNIPRELTLDCDEETTDLSSWIQGICLE
ncbi:spermine oxidase [Harmonia axyridis]|uniref:spermine oxidase n=1 Tax=Harmonia axyridis TaxID=115357 RepID=UPI001E27540E|nr:spermine oxidase [Harmonia axyridis]